MIALHALTVLVLSNHTHPDHAYSPCNSINSSALATDFLRGKHLDVAVYRWPPFAFREEGGDWDGYDIAVFKEIANRAGMTYTFHETTDKLANETWDDVLVRELDKYDVAGTYWSDTAYRRKYAGLVFTHGHVNEGWIVVTTVPTPMDPGIMTFTRPFSRDLWICVCALAIFSACFMWLLEDRSETTITDFLYDAFISFTGFESIAAETYAGRIYNFSFGFCVLIIIASYTANLASILVASQTEGINSLEDAVAKGVSICAMKGGLGTPWWSLKAKYPSINLMEVSSTQAAVLGLLDGKCAAALGGVNALQLSMMNHNSNCALTFVGQQVTEISGAYAVAGRNICVQQTMDAHLVTMRETGVLETMWEGVLDGRSCTAVEEGGDDESDFKLSTDHLLGLWLCHAVMTVIALVFFVIRKLGCDRALDKKLGGNFGDVLDVEKHRKEREEVDKAAAKPTLGLNGTEDGKQAQHMIGWDVLAERLEKLETAVSAMTKLMTLQLQRDSDASTPGTSSSTGSRSRSTGGSSSSVIKINRLADAKSASPIPATSTEAALDSANKSAIDEQYQALPAQYITWSRGKNRLRGFDVTAPDGAVQ